MSARKGLKSTSVITAGILSLGLLITVFSGFVAAGADEVSDLAIIKPGVTGVLVPPQDPEALAHGVADLLHDGTTAATLAGAGRKVVERDYSLEAMVRRFEAIYREVLGG